MKKTIARWLRSLADKLGSLADKLDPLRTGGPGTPEDE